MVLLNVFFMFGRYKVAQNAQHDESGPKRLA